MQISLLMGAAALSLAASTPGADMADDGSHSSMPIFGAAESGSAGCQDQITQAGEDKEFPKLDRQPASSDRPYLIAAVEQRVDGCSVMVMHNDKADFRPLPAPPAGPARLERIR